MTVLLPVDAAYALDYLAILLVKREAGLPVKTEGNAIYGSLRDQIPNFREILDSLEFRCLREVNRQTFDAIEMAHKDVISAKRVQEINHTRYLAKKALQEKFWPSQPLTEQKTLLNDSR